MSNEGKRRRLSFGGLLLITLGVLLLANNFVANFRAIDLFADWWPVLLILWGLVKLTDNLRARSAGEPAPRSLTGGDIFLLILVVVLGLSVAGVRRIRTDHPDFIRLGTDRGCMGWVGERNYTFDETVEVGEMKPGATLRVQVERGSVRVTGVEGSRGQVVARKSLCGTSDERAREEAQRVSVEMVADGGNYILRPKNQATARALRVDLEVTVPKNTIVTVRNEEGAVQVTAVNGGVTVVTQRGDVDVSAVTGDVEVEVRRSSSDAVIRNVKGNVKLTGVGGQVEVEEVSGQAYVQGQYYGTIRLAGIVKEARFLSRRTDLTVVGLKGRLEIGSSGLSVYDVDGNMTLVSTERDVELDNVRGVIRIENRTAGDIEVVFKDAPKNDLTVMTDRGNVEVMAPSNSNFEVTAFAKTGEVQVDQEFKGPELREIESNRDRNVEGRVGKGGPKLMLRTSYGEIRLRAGERATERVEQKAAPKK